MLKSDTIGKLAEALAKAQGVFDPIHKNRTVTVSGKSKTGTPFQYDFDYADLDAIIEATRPGLAANGIAVMQLLGDGLIADTAQLTTMLLHSSGEWISETITYPKKDGDDAKSMQEFGGDTTYMRRYQRGALLDVSAETDDDGGMGKGIDSKQSKAREAKAEEEFDFAIKKRETEGEYGKPAEYWDRWDAAIKSGQAVTFQKPTKAKPAGLKAWRMTATAEDAKIVSETKRTPGVGPDAPPPARDPLHPTDADEAEVETILKFKESKNLAELTAIFNKTPAEWRRPGTKIYGAFKARRKELGAED